jgi:hypothetical protein
MGWREETETKNLIRFTHSPPIKPNSLHDVSEDLANHFEYFLHNPKELNAKSKLASDYIQRMMGKDFKLEKEMRAYLLAFFFIISCSISHPEKPSEIAVMQRIWDLKDPSPAYAQLPQLKKIEEDKKYYVLGISKENSISRLSITYDKQSGVGFSLAL